MQKIFVQTNKNKQVLMFTATLKDDIKKTCAKFMKKDYHEIQVDDESKLTLTGLVQYYKKLEEKEKNKMLMIILNQIKYNQVIIFVSRVDRA